MWRQEQRQDVRNDARRTRIWRWSRTRSGTGARIIARTAGAIARSIWTGTTIAARTAARTSVVPWSITWTTRAARTLCQLKARIGSASETECGERAGFDRDSLIVGRSRLDPKE
jgi:hypothetical protein